MHSNAKLVFRKSNMILKVESDESYLSVPGSRSRAGGHFYFGNMQNVDYIEPTQGAICFECSIIKPVVSSEAEASLAALFINSQKAIIIRRIDAELSHLQLAIPIIYDNTTADSFFRDIAIQKIFKSIFIILH